MKRKVKKDNKPKAKRKVAPQRKAREATPAPAPPSPPVAMTSQPAGWGVCQREACGRISQQHSGEPPRSIPNVCDGFVYAEGITEEAFVGGGGGFGGGGATGAW